MLIRCVLGVAVIAFGATLPALSINRFDLFARSGDGELTIEDEDGQENPLIELDADPEPCMLFEPVLESGAVVIASWIKATICCCLEDEH